MSALQQMIQGYTQRVLGSGRGGGDGSDGGASGNAAQTATAYQKLQEAIANDYGMQKKEFESNPSNAGKSWQMPDTTERFNDQVQAMIYSGDPALQKRGLALLDAPKEESTTALEKTANLLGLSPMQVFQMQHPGPARTNVNVNLPKMDQPMSVDDLQKLQFPEGVVPVPGMSMREVGQIGGRIANTKDQAETGGATAAMTNSLEGMEGNTGTTAKPVPGAVAEARALPGMIGQGINTILNVAGMPQNPNDTKFMADRAMYVGQLTKAMNGAGASDTERENWLRQAPSLTDDPGTRRIKLQALKNATAMFSEAAKNKGARIPATVAKPAEPNQRVTKSGVKYTVSE